MLLHKSEGFGFGAVVVGRTAPNLVVDVGRPTLNVLEGLDVVGGRPTLTVLVALDVRVFVAADDSTELVSTDVLNVVMVVFLPPGRGNAAMYSE